MKKILKRALAGILCSLMICSAAPAVFAKSAEYAVQWLCETAKAYEYLYFINDNFLSGEIDGKLDLLNSNGSVLVEGYEWSTAGADDTYFILKKSGKWGVIDTNGNTIIPFMYDGKDYQYYMEPGILSLTDTLYGASKNGRWGVIDINNNVVIPFEYDSVRYLTDNLFAVTRNNKCGAVDINNNLVLPFDYNYIYASTDTVFEAYTDDNHYCIDINNNIVLDYGYNTVYSITSTLFAASKDGKFGVVDINNNVILPFEYDSVDSISDTLFSCHRDGKSGVVDINNNVVFPFEYSYVYRATDKLISMAKDGTRVLVDINTKAVLPFECEDLYPLTDTLFGAYNDGKYGIVDSNYNIVLPIEHPWIVSAITNNLFIINKDYFMGVIDNRGNTVLPFEYNYGEISSKGTIIKKSSTGRWTISKITEIPKTAVIPSFAITVNGGVIDNNNALYPCIVHNDITYFPMTYFGSRSLGLTTEYTPETGLVIEKAETEPFAPTFEQSTSANEATQNVAYVEGKVTVNGKSINNSAEEYPLIIFRDVTYFPLTWRFAVEEFGWEYNFTLEGGLVINSK